MTCCASLIAKGIFGGIMAILHFAVSPVQRSKSRSSVGAAAYRAGDKILDARTGQIYDYQRKSGVVHSEILLPPGVPQMDRQTLWNLAESAEKRKDGTPAREYTIALPAELNSEERKNLTREFAQHLVSSYGVAVDYSLHAPDKKADGRNFHAHILCSTRVVGNDCLLHEKASVELSNRDRIKAGLIQNKEELFKNRQIFADMCNHYLEMAGHDVRVDPRSYKDRGITDKTPDIHLGPAATAIERRGGLSKRGNINRENRALEMELQQAREEKKSFEIEAQQLQNELKPTPIDIVILRPKREEKKAKPEEGKEKAVEKAKAQEEAERLAQAKAMAERQRPWWEGISDEEMVNQVVKRGIDPREGALEKALPGVNADLLRENLALMANGYPDNWNLSEQEVEAWGERYSLGRVRVYPTQTGMREELVYDDF
jgi:hypothetical protein